MIAPIIIASIIDIRTHHKIYINMNDINNRQLGWMLVVSLLEQIKSYGNHVGDKKLVNHDYDDHARSIMEHRYCTDTVSIVFLYNL